MDEERQPTSPENEGRETDSQDNPPDEELSEGGAAAQRPRPSLRGMGRQILRGESLSEAEIAREAQSRPSIVLQPKTKEPPLPPDRPRPSIQGLGRQLLAAEARESLEVAASAPILEPEEPELERAEALPPVEAALAPSVSLPPAEMEAEPAPEAEYVVTAAVEGLGPTRPESFDRAAEIEEEMEALPLAEEALEQAAPLPAAEMGAEPAPEYASAPEAEYLVAAAVEALTPAHPETSEPGMEVELEPLPEPDLAAFIKEEPAREGQRLPGGGIQFLDTTATDELEAAPAQPEAPPTVEQITDEAVRQLLAVVEQLQEEIIQDVHGERGNTDVYQQELQYASHLLRQDQDYYHDARAIVYRVRADLSREAKVRQWSRRYSRRLLVYLTLSALIIVILGLLQPQVSEIAAQIAVTPGVAGVYMPMLFGALGAVFGGLWVLIEQLFIKHDFDPIDVAWYYLTPLIGLMLGIFVYVFVYAVIASSIETDLGVLSIRQTPYLLWTLCFLAGAAALGIWGRPRRRDKEERPGFALPESPQVEE
jgi:hypothetical protein